MEWIKCSDRMPDKNGRYIITQDRYKVDDYNKTGKCMGREVDVAEFDGVEWRKARFYDVIAWMSMPEPFIG